MNTTIKLKLGLLFSFIVLSFVVLMPSFSSHTPDWWKKYLSPGALRLGLDLQGGMHLVLQVNLPQAEINSLQLAANELKETLAEKSLSAVQTASADPKVAVFTLANTGASEEVANIIKKDFPDLNAKIEAQAGTFPKVFLSLTDKAKLNIENGAVDQSLEILRNRIDQFGVAEPVIVRQGTNQIVIQLPGITDKARAMKLIGDTAQLEFKMVVDSPGVNLNTLIAEAKKNGSWQEKESVAKLNRAIQASLPENTTLYFEKDKDPNGIGEIIRPILLENKTLMTGNMVKNAQVRIGGTFNEPYVSLDLTNYGGKLFGNITEKNVGRRMAIVLDGVVRSAPVIRERILGGSAQISGNFTHSEASDLAIVLRVGALPAPVDIIQNMTVGASLGQDSIQSGVYSGVFGALLVVCFALIYYRLSGLVANVALFLNILFLFVGLAILNSTLTLPGIAGIILSIGMGIDSNVLIFERIRDEIAVGKTVRSGIDAGFDKAFSSILDSQVTALITALALFLFGTGPIKGFAVTLSLGIIFNLYTALTCSQTIFHAINHYRPIKYIKYLQILKRQSLDYMRLRNVMFTISAIMSILGVIALIQIGRGHANLGVDFAGGSLFQFKAEQSFPLEEVRKALTAGGFKDVDLQGVESENRLMIRLEKEERVHTDKAAAVTTLLNEKFPDKHFVMVNQEEIGASVSNTLRNKAYLAIALSLAGIVGYLAFRFDIRFGIAALLSTLHDVFSVIAICWLTNMQMNLLLVTAILTLAGYSLTDTVVIFDRLRENTGKHPELPLSSIINLSVNEVLNRTVITSATTAMVLIALWFFGGPVLHNFSSVLLIGIMIGTYSSIFVASPLLTLMPAKKKA
ncbi:MAG: protein translocase subunit SecD [Desulfobulbaceae bacterium]|jgi:SecD/SecF fusion protein|nr:protein translocase subunit SecD [Desulfobulbaceae bacterium]